MNMLNLFIGVGRGEILPFASYYLTGFLNDKPLRICGDMAAIGVERRADGKRAGRPYRLFVRFDVSGLIRGDYGSLIQPAEQATF